MPKRLVALAAAALVFGALAALVLRRADRLSQTQPLLDYGPSRLLRLEISRQGAETLTLERKAGPWRLTSPVEDLAEAGVCDELISALSGLTVGSEVSGDSAGYDAYGLAESSAAHVRVFSRDSAAPVLDAYFGKPALGGRTLYIRRAREKPVFLAEGLDARLLSGRAERYRERAFFPDSLGPLSAIRLTSGAKSLQLEKGTPDWDTASRLRVADFAAGNLADAETGLDRPVLVVEAQGALRSERWSIGKPHPKAKGKSVFRYARGDGRPGVLAVVAVFDSDALLKELNP